MQIAFRADASLLIGTGHVMRCLTLADALAGQGARCIFICREHEGHLFSLIEQRGHKALSLPAPIDDYEAQPGFAHAAWLGTDWATDAEQTRKILAHRQVDWLVVDHYALDSRWENALRSCAKRLMVIDDLADRPHDCDMLLDQNLGRSAQDYSSLLKPGTTILIGPQYALLRPEFAALRVHSLARRSEPRLKHLLITMGGVDKDNATGQVLEALKECTLPQDSRISVVMGPHAPWLDKVREQAANMPRPTEVLAGVSNMAQLMVDSDLAIGAAGSTSWERCCLGLPTVMMVLALNQREAAQHLLNSGAVQLLDSDSSIKDTLLGLMREIKCSNELLKSLSNRAAVVTDGNGVVRTVSQLM